MEIQLRNLKEEKCGCEALILPLIQDGKDLPKGLSAASARLVRNAFSRGFSAKPNETLIIYSPDGVMPSRILLVGLGERSKVSPEHVRQTGGRSVSVLRDHGIGKAALSTALLNDLGCSPSFFVEGALLGQYAFQRYRKGNERKPLKNLVVLSRQTRSLAKEMREVRIIADAVSFARDLVNTPANDMTPSHLARAAQALKGRRVSVKVISRDAARRAGLGAYLAVASGSAEPPKFIVVDYKGARKRPVVVIGKSVTFDSGGLSLKPSDGMEKMKYDMAGGAAVLGMIRAASALNLADRIIAILPATENLPGGNATKPGDVVRTADGKSVEIINTDAEGRLTIADAIAYAKRFKPRMIIDIATLTGACAIAFGGEVIAMSGNDRVIIEALKKAGEKTYERVWEMPLFEEYREYLKSDIADIKNLGGRIGGLMTSAYFLYEFVGQIPWAHLDIAGTAWVEKDKPYVPKGAAGVGVRLLLESLRNLA